MESKIHQPGITANLTTDRNALEPFDNARTTAIGDRDTRKNAIRPRLAQFRSAVKGLLFGSAYVRSLPKMPPIGAAAGCYLQPFDDMANLWSQINTAPPAGFTPPLILPTGYTQALFATDIGLVASGSVTWFKVYVLTTTGNEKGSNAVKIIRP